MDLQRGRDAVYLRTGYTTDDGQLTPERVNQCLRSALNFIASEHDWDWLQSQETLTTTSGTNYVTPGSTWIRTLGFVGPNQDDTLRLPRLEFWLLPQSSTGQPSIWCDYQGRIYLWPVPDGAYAFAHYFIRTETTLATDTDAPIMPEQFQDGWIEYAAYLAFRRVGDAERAQEAYTAYQDWQRVTMDNRHRARGPSRIAVRPGAWV